MASPLPPWMPEPPEPHPVAGGSWFPHIIRHEVQDNGTVLVTWSLPGLQVATVRVPLTTWLNGDHWPTGEAIAGQITPFLPAPYRPAPQPPTGEGQEALTEQEG